MRIYILAFFAAISTMASVASALSYVAYALAAVHSFTVDPKTMELVLFSAAFNASLAIFLAILALRVPAAARVGAHAGKPSDKRLEGTS